MHNSLSACKTSSPCFFCNRTKINKIGKKRERRGRGRESQKSKKKKERRNARRRIIAVMISHPRRGAAPAPSLLSPDPAAHQRLQSHPQLNAASKYDFVKASKSKKKLKKRISRNQAGEIFSLDTLFQPRPPPPNRFLHFSYFSVLPSTPSLSPNCSLLLLFNRKFIFLGPGLAERRPALLRAFPLPRRPHARRRGRAPRQGQEGRARPQEAPGRRRGARCRARGYGEGAVRCARGAGVRVFFSFFCSLRLF